MRKLPGSCGMFSPDASEGQRRLALMQPYFFPYLGYFSLLAASDAFVFYTDCSYRKQGWINRNRWLLGNAPQYFTVPLFQASSHKTIAEVMIDPSAWPKWQSAFLKSLRQGYAKTPYSDAVIALVEATFKSAFARAEEKNDAISIAHVAMESVRQVAAFTGLTTPLADNRHYFSRTEAKLEGQAYVLALCQKAGALQYLNLPGGKQLYDPKAFERHGCRLRFVSTTWSATGSMAERPGFENGLSVLDTLCYLGPDGTREAIAAYSIEEAQAMAAFEA